MPEAGQPTFDSTLLDATARMPEHVVFRSFVSETVVLDLQTCRYHGLNSTGGRMLEVLSEVGQVGTAAKKIADEYDVPLDRIQEDIVVLCKRLAAQGLLELQSPAAS